MTIGRQMAVNYSANACTGNETIQDGVNSPLLSEYAWYCANNQ